MYIFRRRSGIYTKDMDKICIYYSSIIKRNSSIIRPLFINIGGPLSIYNLFHPYIYPHMPACVHMCKHMSAYDNICPHMTTCAYIRPHTSVYAHICSRIPTRHHIHNDICIICIIWSPGVQLHDQYLPCVVHVDTCVAYIPTYGYGKHAVLLRKHSGS